jgi:hypothetical protein
MYFCDYFLLSPDGQYLLIQFQNSFQFKAGTMITVVLDCNTSPACSAREYLINKRPRLPKTDSYK